MPDAPTFKVNPNPRISLNHLSKYLATVNPSSRSKIIRDAKYVRSVGGASSYSQARHAIRGFLFQNNGDFTYFDSALSHLQATYETASGPKAEGIKAESKRCIRAINAFKAAYSKKRWTGVTFLKPEKAIHMNIEGTDISVDLDAVVEHFKGNYTQRGGLLSFFVTADRVNIDHRRKCAANMIYWAGQSNNQSMPVSHKYCLSMDVFEPKTQAASDSTTQFRQKVKDACDTISLKWETVTPPKAYKG